MLNKIVAFSILIASVFTQSEASFPVEPLGWSNFPGLNTPAYSAQQQLTGSLNPDVSLEITGAYLGGPFIGLTVTPPALITTTRLHAFGVRNSAGSTTPINVVMSGVGGDILLRHGDAFHLSELHISSLINFAVVTDFEARSGGQLGTLLNNSLVATNADYGSSTVNMLYDPILKTISPDLSGPPTVPSNTGTIFLTNTSGMNIDYIAFTINPPGDGAADFVPFGVAAAVPEPGTYLTMAGMIGVCLFLLSRRKAHQ